MQIREKVGKSRNTVFFQWFVAPEGRKVGSLKRRVRSQLARGEMKNCTPLWREAHFEVKTYKTPVSDDFWKLRCRKSARRCGAKHISKSKCTKHTSVGPLLDVEMSKKCTKLWCQAHFEVKSAKNWGVWRTFGRSDVASRGRRKGFCTLSKVSKTWGFPRISNYNHHYTTLHSNTLHSITFNYTQLHYTTLHYTTLHYTTLYYTTLHYLPLHYITLRYTTLHYTTLHYLPLHYITLHYTPLHYTSLHYTTLHSTTLHYITRHYTPQHYNYKPTLHYTPLHSTTLDYTKFTTLHYISLHCTPLHCTTLHYTTLHYTTFHYTSLHYTTLHSTTLQLQLHNYTTTQLHSTTLHYTPLH